MNTRYLNALPEDWQPIAAIYAALGDETRQKILLLFEPGEELSIKTIAGLFPLGRTTIVHHLGILEKAGILSVRREGKLALYSLKPDVVLQALDGLREYILDGFLATDSGPDSGQETV